MTSVSLLLNVLLHAARPVVPQGRRKPPTSEGMSERD